jgi:acylphosphatase
MTEPHPLHINIHVKGKVQGVWYRKSACEEALRLGLVGFTQNLPDGSVLIEAEGGREALDALLAWCRTGPPLAEVGSVQFEEGALAGHHGFTVRR